MIRGASHQYNNVGIIQFKLVHYLGKSNKKGKGTIRAISQVRISKSRPGDYEDSMVSPFIFAPADYNLDGKWRMEDGAWSSELHAATVLIPFQTRFALILLLNYIHGKRITMLRIHIHVRYDITIVVAYPCVQR